MSSTLRRAIGALLISVAAMAAMVTPASAQSTVGQPYFLYSQALTGPCASGSGSYHGVQNISIRHWRYDFYRQYSVGANQYTEYWQRAFDKAHVFTECNNGRWRRAYYGAANTGQITRKMTVRRYCDSGGCGGGTTTYGSWFRDSSWR